MKNFVHGCHLITANHQAPPAGPVELWLCLGADRSPWSRDGSALLFTSLFRADQYIRQTAPEIKNYLQTKISLDEVAGKFDGQNFILNPCAFCAHHCVHHGSEKNLRDTLLAELGQSRGQAERYLADARQALRNGHPALAVETLLVIVEHLAPDLAEAHALLETCATALGDAALLKAARSNLAALK